MRGMGVVIICLPTPYCNCCIIIWENIICAVGNKSQ